VPYFSRTFHRDFDFGRWESARALPLGPSAGENKNEDAASASCGFVAHPGIKE
jgi:hypothetical protein